MTGESEEKALFLGALDQEPGERKDWVHARASTPRLAARVLRLLASHGAPDPELDRSPTLLLLELDRDVVSEPRVRPRRRTWWGLVGVAGLALIAFLLSHRPSDVALQPPPKMGDSAPTAPPPRNLGWWWAQLEREAAASSGADALRRFDAGLDACRRQFGEEDPRTRAAGIARSLLRVHLDQWEEAELELQLNLRPPLRPSSLSYLNLCAARLGLFACASRSGNQALAVERARSLFLQIAALDLRARIDAIAIVVRGFSKPG